MSTSTAVANFVGAAVFGRCFRSHLGHRLCAISGKAVSVDFKGEGALGYRATGGIDIRSVWASTGWRRMRT